MVIVDLPIRIETGKFARGLAPGLRSHYSSLSFAGRSGMVTRMFLVTPLSTHFDMIKLAADGTVAAGTFPDPAISG